MDREKHVTEALDKLVDLLECRVPEIALRAAEAILLWARPPSAEHCTAQSETAH